MKKGFTLVELLVVVAILGVLAAVGIVSFGGYMSRTKVTAIKNQVNDVAKFIQLKMTECSMNPGSMNLHTPASWDQFLTNPGHCVNSSMEQMKAGIYNHINDTWNQFNVYEKKTPALYSGPYNTNPSQGYIHFGFLFIYSLAWACLIHALVHISSVLYTLLFMYPLLWHVRTGSDAVIILENTF